MDREPSTRPRATWRSPRSSPTSRTRARPRNRASASAPLISPSPQPAEPPPAGETREIPPAPAGGPINLNSATFEQLREAGLSVTQTGRVLAHRERSGGFQSLDELDAIPGFPREFLDQIKPRLTA